MDMNEKKRLEGYLTEDDKWALDALGPDLARTITSGEWESRKRDVKRISFAPTASEEERYETMTISDGLIEANNSLWTDSSTVMLDSTCLFGKGYDTFGLEFRRQEFHTPIGSYVIWPSGRKWSCYGTCEGALWFECFSTEEEAKKCAEVDFNKRNSDEKS